MLKDLIAQLKANLRLRLGLGVIVAILWLYGLLTLQDRAHTLRAADSSLASRITHVRGVLAQHAWGPRLTSARLQEVALESTLWQGETFGLAQATFQDWLNQALAQAAVGRPDVTMGAGSDNGSDEGSGNASDGPRDLWAVEAKVEFDFNPQNFNEFMMAVEKSPRLIRISSLAVQEDPIPRVNAVLVAYFEKPKKG